MATLRDVVDEGLRAIQKPDRCQVYKKTDTLASFRLPGYSVAAAVTPFADGQKSIHGSPRQVGKVVADVMDLAGRPQAIDALSLVEIQNPPPDRLPKGRRQVIVIGRESKKFKNGWTTLFQGLPLDCYSARIYPETLSLGSSPPRVVSGLEELDGGSPYADSFACGKFALPPLKMLPREVKPGFF